MKRNAYYPRGGVNLTLTILQLLHQRTVNGNKPICLLELSEKGAMMNPSPVAILSARTSWK